jgi:DNA-binding transcriptional MerR regulator
MREEDAFTLTEAARRLEVPQHRLIHLCEKEAVIPDLGDASGRGTSRLFSRRNLLEFAVALRLRDMMLPVAAIRALLYVLRAFEARLERDLPGFALPDSLRDPGTPDLRIVVADGRTIFFSMGRSGEKSKVFGGIPLAPLMEEGRTRGGAGHRRVRLPKLVRQGHRTKRLEDLEGSRFGRLELSVTAIARDLPLDG